MAFVIGRSSPSICLSACRLERNTNIMCADTAFTIAIIVLSACRSIIEDVRFRADLCRTCTKPTSSVNSFHYYLHVCTLPLYHIAVKCRRWTQLIVHSDISYIVEYCCDQCRPGHGRWTLFNICFWAGYNFFF